MGLSRNPSSGTSMDIPNCKQYEEELTIRMIEQNGLM
jgi:hypothetical protein